MTDTEILDFLQELNDRADYTGECVLRESGTGRGWRLHEADDINGQRSVRQAIIDFKKEQE